MTVIRDFLYSAQHSILWPAALYSIVRPRMFTFLWKSLFPLSWSGLLFVLAPFASSSSSAQSCQMAKFDPFLSLDCARVEGVGAQSKERKGSNLAAQRSGAIVQKPEGPYRYELKIRLQPSGNHDHAT